MTEESEGRYLLTLFVSGGSPLSDRALASLRRICDDELDGRYELEVVDVLERPERAEQEAVVATPMLLKRFPPPLRRVIGDFSDRDSVLMGLDLRPTSREPGSPS